jgi:multimeric flavodoxin WrbA
METSKMLFILDGESRTDLSEDIRTRITEIARAKRRGVEAIELRRSDTPPCTGCLHCLTKHPGACVSNRSFAAIAQQASECPMVVFLAPVVFGTYGSTMKNVIDRGGLIIKNHGSCRQIVIGYGEGATDEERSTFIDITTKHRGKANIVHPNCEENFEVYFTRSREDNRLICENLKEMM